MWAYPGRIAHTARPAFASTQHIALCRLQPLLLVDPDVSRLGVGLPWQNCSSPLAFHGLPAGQYGFTLRATDYAGNSRDSKCACQPLGNLVGGVCCLGSTGTVNTCSVRTFGKG